MGQDTYLWRSQSHGSRSHRDLLYSVPFPGFERH